MVYTETINTIKFRADENKFVIVAPNLSVRLRADVAMIPHVLYESERRRWTVPAANWFAVYDFALRHRFTFSQETIDKMTALYKAQRAFA